MDKTTALIAAAIVVNIVLVGLLALARRLLTSVDASQPVAYHDEQFTHLDGADDHEPPTGSLSGLFQFDSWTPAGTNGSVARHPSSPTGR